MKYVVIIALLLLPGCAATNKPPVYAEYIVDTSEAVIDQADAELSPALEAALERTADLEAGVREAELHPLLVGAEILERADQAARLTRIALETWDASTAEHIQQRLVCLVARLADVLSIMKTMGLPIPEQLAAIVTYGQTVVGTLCPM